MKKTKWEQVGVMGVDAGLCWIGDPCYVLHADELPKSIGGNWQEFCDNLENMHHSKTFNFDKGHEGLGVCVSTGYGDGSYPVYIKKNDEGRVCEVKVVFI